MMAGSVVFLGGAVERPRDLMPRAREVLGLADCVVSALDLSAFVKASCEWKRDAPADELIERARRGQLVVRVSSSEAPLGDDDVLLAVVRAGVLVEVAWLERRPLFGKRVLVTRTLEQSRATAQLLRARGAEPVVVPAIEIHPPRDPKKLAAAVARLSEALCVVFTSANGVDRVFAELAKQKKDARAFGGAKIAAIGPGTASALEAHGLTPDIIAREFKQEGLAEDIILALAGAKGKILLLRAEVARDALPTALREAGHDVEIVAAYETRAPEPSRAAALAKELEAGAIDAVTFTSSSTVDNLCDVLGARAPELLATTCVASIGPVTTKTCEARGLRVDVTAQSYTISGLIDALEAHVSAIDKAGGGRRSSGNPPRGS